MDKFGSYIRNLKRKRLRTALAVLGIAVGVFSVVIIMAIGATGKSVIIGEIDRLGLSGLSVQSDELKLTDAEVEQIESVADGEVMPLIVRYSPAELNGSEFNAVLFGVGANMCEIAAVELLHGRVFTDREISSAAAVCIVSSDDASAAYSRGNICGKELDLTLGSSSVSLRIVGVAEAGTGNLSGIVGESFPSFVYMPYSTLADFCGADSYDRVSIAADGDAETVSAAISEQLDRYSGIRDAYSVTDITRERERYTRILDIVTAVIGAVGGISLLVAGLMIMTLMLVSVSERDREIGIKKALGARSSNIVAEFLTESVVISVLGGFIGLLLCFAVSGAAKLIIGTALTITLPTALLGISLSCGTGILFGVYPAFKASRLRPVEALRR